MQDFDFGSERFGLIFSAFRSFQHVLTVEDQLTCLHAVRLGGDSLFDVFAPKLERLAILDEPEFEEARWKEKPRSSAYRTSAAIPRRGSLEVSGPSRRSRSETVRTKMRYFFRYELEHLLARSGFSTSRSSEASIAAFDFPGPCSRRV